MKGTNEQINVSNAQRWNNLSNKMKWYYSITQSTKQIPISHTDINKWLNKYNSREEKTNLPYTRTPNNLYRSSTLKEEEQNHHSLSIGCA